MRSYTAASGRRSLSVCAAVAEPDRPLWFPGSTPPPWLDGSLPGDFGFDPLGLGKFNPNQILFFLNYHLFQKCKLTRIDEFNHLIYE